MLKIKPILPVLLLIMVFIFSENPVFAQKEETTQRHPSYNLLGRDAPDTTNPESPLNPDFIMGRDAANASRLNTTSFWRSPQIDGRIVGLWVGDINNDGKNELVYATLRHVYVAVASGSKLDILANYEVPFTNRLISLDVLDIDGDGVKEIILSNQKDDLLPAGYILNYVPASKEILVKSEKIPWYMRVVETPNGAKLIGQRGSIKMRQAFEGSPRYLVYDQAKATVSQGDAIVLPKNVSIFNVIYGRLSSHAVMVTLRFPDEHIWLSSLDGNSKLWETNEEYAGTINHIKMSMGKRNTTKHEYLPARFLLIDIDNDGQNELIVAQNDRGGIPFMSKLRSFSGGSVVAFKYDGLSLNEYFRTNRLPGAAVDYRVADFNNNGKPDLVIAIVTESGSGIWEEARSSIVAFELVPSSGSSKSSK